jgi:hypothetical protein
MLVPEKSSNRLYNIYLLGEKIELIYDACKLYEFCGLKMKIISWLLVLLAFFACQIPMFWNYSALPPTALHPVKS